VKVTLGVRLQIGLRIGPPIPLSYCHVVSTFERRTRLAYPILLALGALDAAGYGLIAPVLPRIAASNDVGPAVIGMLVACFPLGIVIGFPLAGRAIRRRATRQVLLASLALLAIGSVGFVLGSSLPIYFVSRFVMGVGSGGLWIAVTFSTLERWPGQEYECMGRIFAAYSVGGLLGPAFGAIGGVRGPFLVYLLLVAASVPMARLLPAPVTPIEFRSDRSVLGLRRFWAASAGVLFAYLALGITEGILPLHFAEGVSQQGLGVLYMGMSLVVAAAAAKATRFAPRTMVVVSTVLVTVGLGFAGATSLPFQWIAALVVAGVGIGAGTTGSTGVLLETVPSERIVTAMIVWSEIGIAGYLAGPLAGGVIAQNLGFGALWVIPAIAGAATVVTLVWAYPRRRPRFSL
jgi:MFS family permease